MTEENKENIKNLIESITEVLTADEHKHIYRFVRLEYLDTFDFTKYQMTAKSGYYSVWVCDCGQMKKVRIKENIIFE